MQFTGMGLNSPASEKSIQGWTVKKNPTNAQTWALKKKQPLFPLNICEKAFPHACTALFILTLH
jgi:hypothetical protein